MDCAITKSSSTIKKTETKEKEEEEDILIPSENPEEITSLLELETKIGQIKKLLENKNLNPEDKKKKNNYKIYTYNRKIY